MVSNLVQPFRCENTYATCATMRESDFNPCSLCPGWGYACCRKRYKTFIVEYGILIYGFPYRHTSFSVFHGLINSVGPFAEFLIYRRGQPEEETKQCAEEILENRIRIIWNQENGNQANGTQPDGNRGRPNAADPSSIEIRIHIQQLAQVVNQTSRSGLRIHLYIAG